MNALEIVDVTLRDGIQPIGPWIPTERKIDLLHNLAATGLGRMEVGAFVSANAMPQMRDTAAVLEAALAIPGLRAQVLVPTARRAAEAVAAGARELAFVLSVSEAHNQANLRRSVDESVADYARFADETPPDIAIRLNLATSFDCPFTGLVPEDAMISLLGRLLPMRPEVEVCLCDTTGRATPDHVDRLIALAIAHHPNADGWAFHGHDTYAMGSANAYAAYNAGVRVIDAASGGLGGCPFAPGATGNVATEDLIWMFERMGVPTGVDLDRLIGVAEEAAALPGSLAGGRVRQAMSSQTQTQRRAAAAKS
jgi:hydroxymethylglutaryl-CoA lyase